MLILISVLFFSLCSNIESLESRNEELLRSLEEAKALGAQAGAGRLPQPLTPSDDPCATRGAVTTGSQVSDEGSGSCLKTGQHSIFVITRKIKNTRMLDTLFIDDFIDIMEQYFHY